MAGGDTIAALSSGQPPAGIAIIRVSGPRAHAVGEALSGTLPPPRRASLRQFRDPVTREVIDEGLLLAFPKAASATGDPLIEFHGHGGRAVIKRLLDAILSIPGVRLAEPGEFTRRALENGRIDLTEADGLADLLAAETELQRKVALARATGTVFQQLERWRSAVLELSADAEVAIDYPDEEDGVAAPDLGPRLLALRDEIADALNAPTIDRLRDGFRVVLAGPPNAGKSSLINALTETDRAIVTSIPGTTRDTIEVPVSINGVPVVLIDTAGLRESENPIEALGVERSNRELERADLILWLGPEGERVAQAAIMEIHPKADLRRGSATDSRLRVSAKTGEGLPELRERIAAVLSEKSPNQAQIALTDRERHLLHKFVEELHFAYGVEPLLQAEHLRTARTAIEKITGRVSIEDVLSALFSRFCLGK